MSAVTPPTARPRAAEPARRSPFVEVSRASALELLRNGKIVASMMFMFGFFLLLIVWLNAVLADSPDVPGGDYLRLNLATCIVVGYLAIAITGTTVPLVALRERGTLRLLGTTPLKRLTFLLAQTPARFALGAAEALVILAIALARGYLDPLQTLRLSVTLLLGLVMLFSFGYLLASRLRNAEVANQFTGLIPIIVLLTSGTVFPPSLFPDWLVPVLNAIPTAWFIQAAGADLSGYTPFASVYVLWGLMAAATVVATLLAARLFRWDIRDR